jgi:hypothetical protein
VWALAASVGVLLVGCCGGLFLIFVGMKPEQAAPTQKETPAPMEFDETDVDSTIRWLAVENDRITNHNPKGNLFTGKTKDELLAELLKIPVGQSVRWNMKLSGVSRTGNVVGVSETARHPAETIPMVEQGSYHSIAVRPAKADGDLPFSGFSPAEPETGSRQPRLAIRWL